MPSMGSFNKRSQSLNQKQMKRSQSPYRKRSKQEKVREITFRRKRERLGEENLCWRGLLSLFLASQGYLMEILQVPPTKRRHDGSWGITMSKFRVLYCFFELLRQGEKWFLYFQDTWKIPISCLTKVISFWVKSQYV